ncbi:MAG: polysaccharide deacetylase family protein, partial [Anaerolineae bacterium]|nr:polysaccharide deacetylase family protein [Anaerolineae bacterium]
MRGLGRVKQVPRRVKRQFKPVAVILMYHRIADVPIDPRGTAVAPANFAQHLKYIQETCHPMHLLDLVDLLGRHPIPHRTVVITFDDGHASVFERAYPLLASAQVPATIFVTTGSIDDPHDFWWDELDRVLLLPEDVPDYLHLPLGGQEYQWVTGNSEARLQAYHAIRPLVRTATNEEREKLLSYLYRWADVGRTAPPDCRPMTSAELARLAQDGLI